jgi:hypothetical protein
MGIEDYKAILQWLIKRAPKAFFYRLPAAFSANLVVHEMSSLMMNAFHSPSVISGHDFVSYLHRPLIAISQAPVAPPVSPSNGGGESWTQYSVASHSESSPPTEEELEIWAPEEFLPHVNGKKLIYVMTRDNSEHLPENRRMVHDHRYGGKGDRDPRRPFTEEELKSQCLHIREDRPMPGVVNLDASAEGQNPLIENWREIRQRSIHTPALRDAYQNYGMWAVAQRLKEPRILPVGTEDRIAVLFDYVLGDFPVETYMKRELHELPKGWAHQGRKEMQTVQLISGRSLPPVEPPRIGEADLKIVWFVEHFAAVRDHVLIRCNDSDVIFILLLHMERWRRQGRATMQVFLDTMPQAKDRRHSRFIWLNKLADYLANRVSGGGDPLPAGFPMGNRAFLGSYLISFVALCCGSDYTRKFHFITSSKIFDALDNKGGWTLIKDLLNEAVVVNPDLIPKLYASSDGYQRGQGGTLFLMRYPAGVALFRLLFLLRMTEKWLTGQGIVIGRPLIWSELVKFNKQCHSQKATADKFSIPSEREIEVHLRQIHWTLLYWANSHLDMGLFPSALSTVDDSEGKNSPFSIWGWLSAPDWATSEGGLSRTLLERLDQLAYEQNWQLPKLLESPQPLDLQAPTAEEREGKKKLHICHARRVAPEGAIWAHLVAEWLTALHGPSKESVPVSSSSSSSSSGDDEDSTELRPRS